MSDSKFYDFWSDDGCEDFNIDDSRFEHVFNLYVQAGRPFFVQCAESDDGDDEYEAWDEYADSISPLDSYQLSSFK
jgi:hypothetical protein